MASRSSCRRSNFSGRFPSVEDSSTGSVSSTRSWDIPERWHRRGPSPNYGVDARRDLADSTPQPLEPGLEHFVRDRERETSPTGSAGAEALAGCDGAAGLEQPLGRQAVGQLPPEVERALGRDVRENF